jgi:hypothetical protein
MTRLRFDLLLLVPLAAFTTAFLVLPLVDLVSWPGAAARDWRLTALPSSSLATAEA